MGCTLFYKKCQEVDTVSKLILLGVPNSIKEEVIQSTLNTVLANLEITLLNTDSEYKLTKEQKKWIKYAVVNEFPPGMPWEDAEEKKKKQGSNNARLAYVLQVHQPDYKRIRNSVKLQSSASYGSNNGEIRLSQSRSRKMTANRGKRHVISRWSRHTDRFS
jgi:hypothetical protein